MSQNYIQDYMKAGKAVIAAKKLARRIIIPNALFLDFPDTAHVPEVGSSKSHS